MSYGKQKKLFVDAIDTIKNLPLIDGVTIKNMDRWYNEDGSESNFLHFPIKIVVEYEIKNIGDVYLELQTNLERTQFDGLEIVSIDVNERYRNEGYGHKLIEQAKLISKKFNVRLYGDCMKTSKEFYLKCGFEVKGLKFEMLP